MEFKVVDRELERVGADTLVLTAWTEGIGHTQVVDDQVSSLLTRLWNQGKISGKSADVKVVYTDGSWEQIVVLGLGDRQKITLEEARLAGAALTKALDRLKSKKTCLLGDFVTARVKADEVTGAVVEGMVLAGYRFEAYKTSHAAPEAGGESIVEIMVEPEEVANVRRCVDCAVILAESTNLARDLVNEPANTLTPLEFSVRAERIAAEWGIEYEILGLQDMARLGMGGIVGVSQGSIQEPRFIVLKYSGRGQGKTLGFVGKGITFDSGGISLKSVKAMDEMKSDMAGGAAVLGAMTAIARLKPCINVTGIIPASENLPSGSAMKPGDIIRMMDGTTVEILSTDAEGRLILADAITYAREQGIEPVIDVATLTGACSVALGPIYSGLWSNDAGLQQIVLAAAQVAGEKVWPMPMDEGYYERTKSKTADLKNSGGGEGGACSAAAFLGHFARSTPWVHLDIAPTGWSDGEKGYTKRGGTGVMVRTLARLAFLWAEK